MYIPSHYKSEDIKKALEFARRFNFGLLTSVQNSKVTVTHLPFIIEESNGEIIVTSHMARANSQWENMEEQDVLVVFSEPHAYISPRLYEKVLNVPTWNYLAVHMTGQVEIVSDEVEMMSLMESMIKTFDPSYIEQLKKLPDSYMSGMMRGVVGFKIKVDDIQFKEKLSQNKTDVERSRIVNSLRKSSNSSEIEIANYMEQLLGR